MESKNQADSSKKAASAPELTAQRNANSAQAAEESGKKTSLSFIIGATVAVGVGAYFLLNGLKPITGEEEAAKTAVTEDQVFEADIDAPGVFASADGSESTPAPAVNAAAVDQENLTLADAAETEVSEVPIVFEGDPAPAQTASASATTSSAMAANLVEGSEVPIEFNSEPLPALAETSAETSEAEATELAMASEAEDAVEEGASDEPVSAPPPAAPAPEPEPEPQPEPKPEPKPEPASTEAESPDAPPAVASTAPAPEPVATPSTPAPRAAPPARRAVSPAPVRNRPPPPNLYTKWWPAAESEKLNVLFVGPAQFGTAIAILTDGPFADAASANEQITVRNLTGGKASGSWKVADGNDRMLVFETDKGPYSVKISDKLADKDGRSFSRQASGNVLVK
tara:strand:+ start:1420 stop:2613 length:1194 start_codon:yes stop_codon:yes gene_type:complete